LWSHALLSSTPPTSQNIALMDGTRPPEKVCM
jgi:hypothetical protein